MHKTVGLLFILFGLVWNSNVPPKSTFYLTENLKKCLLVSLMADVEVNYESTDGTKNVKLFNVTSTSERQTDGDCGENDSDKFAQIIINMPEGQKLTLNFTNTNKNIYLQGMEFDYVLNNESFTSPNKTGPQTALKPNANVYLSQIDHHYQCETKQEFELLPDVTLTMYWAQIQAFKVVNDTFSKIGENCTIGATSVTPAVTTRGTVTPTVTTRGTVTPTVTTRETVTPNSNHSTTTSNTTEPTEHTTESSNMTSEATRPVVTSTAMPHTTAPPAKTPKYYVQDSSTGNICLVAQFTAKFDINYETTKKVTKTITLDSSQGKSQGTCTPTEESLILEWYPEAKTDSIPWTLELVFSRPQKKTALKASVQADGPDYSLSNIILNYTVDATLFPGVKKPGNMSASSYNADRYKTSVGSTYTCLSGTTEKLGKEGVVMKTTDFIIEPFRNSNSTDFQGKKKDCAVDAVKNNLVPIIVGVVLAVLVVVVLVIYLIGRRRQSASNYETL